MLVTHRIQKKTNEHANTERLDRFPRQMTAKRSQLLFDSANALASVQVNLTTSVVYVTWLILAYLLRFYIILAISYKRYLLRIRIFVITNHQPLF